MFNAVEYLRIDALGLHARVHGDPILFKVDTAIVCAGQLSSRTFFDELAQKGITATLVVEHSSLWSSM